MKINGRCRTKQSQVGVTVTADYSPSLERVRQITLQLADRDPRPGILQQPAVQALPGDHLLGPGSRVGHQGVPPPVNTRPIPGVVGHLGPAVVTVCGHDFNASLNLKR